MTQQTIELDANPSDETMSEDLKQTLQRSGIADQAEAAWNPPKEAARGCLNTGIHHVGLRAIYSLIVAVIGSVVVLVIYHAVRRAM